MADEFVLILLTGSPGVGKTTIVKNIVDALVRKHALDCHGFYTAEVRCPSMQKRIGFDVVSLDHKTVPLARSNVLIKGPRVGNYGVHVKEFEELVLPILKPSQNKLLIIDEVGKMELKSKLFEEAVYNCLYQTSILATIPYKMSQPLTLVEKMKGLPHSKLIVVTKENRNKIQATVLEHILKIMKKTQ